MKPSYNRLRQSRRGSQSGHKVKDTLSGFINPTRSHAADFRRILPSAMDKLVAEGLFEKLPSDERGRPQYKITAKGLLKLRELESKC